MGNHLRRYWRLLVPTVLVALGVAACGGSDDEGTNSTKAAAGATPGKLTQLKISLYPSSDYAALYAGMQKGIFTKHGIEPIVTHVLTGAAITAEMTSGKADLGTNSVASMATAIANGIPVKMVVASDAIPTEGYAEVLVRKDSPIKAWGDLAGKQVATVNLQGLFDLGVRNAVEKAGGDPKSVKALAMAPTDEPAALDAKRVDAIVLQDPFLATAMKTGKYRSLGNPYGQLNYKMLSAGFYATDKVIGQKADALKRFKAAFEESTKLIQGDEGLAREIIPTYTALQGDVAEQIGLPIYSTEAPQDSVDQMTAQMKALGWIKSAPSYADQVWAG
jgi:NitT/TauT family transport system substrate-binding protein